MYYVQIRVRVPDAQARDAFVALTDFERFPHLTDAVHAVSVELNPHGGRTSSWQVDFAGGILKWQERDQIDEQLLRIDFELLDGDLPYFEGSWVVQPSDGDCLVEFKARFDLDVPGMADVLEPVAGQALADTVISILHGVLGARTVVTDRDEQSLLPSGAGDVRD